MPKQLSGERMIFSKRELGKLGEIYVTNQNTFDYHLILCTNLTSNGLYTKYKSQDEKHIRENAGDKGTSQLSTSFDGCLDMNE